MSLINKMLQDLDARGSAPGEPLPAHIKPVAHERGGPDRRVIAACVAGACIAAGAGWFGWMQYGSAHAPRLPAPAAAGATAPATKPAVVPGQMSSTITLTANTDAVPTPAPAPVSEAVAANAPRAATAVAAVPAPSRAAAADADSVDPAAGQSSLAPTAGGKTVPAAGRTPVREPAAKNRAATVAKAAVTATTGSTALAVVPEREPAREQSASQRAEGEYRRALASLQEGRMIETIAALESALRIDPGHEPARQTLVGLFIEAGRPDDAMRQLQLGLTQDARQPALAMLLARLQIERGGNGVDTLRRTLPYAGNNPDYHAFLAGALQREGRHREAAAEYLVALRAAPAAGVWWMGLGVSLQAEKRNAEALEAFQKAQGTGALSPELQAFVERQLRQLGR